MNEKEMLKWLQRTCKALGKDINDATIKWRTSKVQANFSKGGVFIEIEKSGAINIQFRGELFALLQNAYEKIRDVYLPSLTLLTNTPWRLTRFDIAFDYAGIVNFRQLLPHPEDENFRYLFRFRYSPHGKNIGKMGPARESGISLRGSQWKLNMYDKVLENETHGESISKEKQEFYRSLYPEGSKVFRLELSLMSSRGAAVATALMGKGASEDELMRLVMADWASRHKIKKVMPTKNTSRWPEHPNFLQIFGAEQVISPLVAVGLKKSELSFEPTNHGELIRYLTAVARIAIDYEMPVKAIRRMFLDIFQDELSKFVEKQGNKTRTQKWLRDLWK